VLTAEELSQELNYLVYWYQHKMRMCLQSGNHEEFVAYVGNQPYLFLFYMLLKDAPIAIKQYALPSLPNGVKSESMTKATKKVLRKLAPRSGKGPGKGGRKGDAVADAILEVNSVVVINCPCSVMSHA